MNPAKMRPQGSPCDPVDSTITTKKKLITMTPTINLSATSKILYPLLLESYNQTPQIPMAIKSKAQRYSPPEKERIPKFCRRAAVPKENWGMAQTILAISVAMAQPHPKTGLTCWLRASNGRSPVDKVM